MKTRQLNLELEQPSCSYASILNGSPIPKPSQKRNIKTKSRIAEGSKIITSSPYKRQLEEQVKIVNAKSAKKKAKPRLCNLKIKKKEKA